MRACRFHSALFIAVTIGVTLGMSSSVLAQQSSLFAPTVSHSLITQPVDESQLTILKGNTHPLARPAGGIRAAAIFQQFVLAAARDLPRRRDAA